jgi:copper chaperone CopZ
LICYLIITRGWLAGLLKSKPTQLISSKEIIMQMSKMTPIAICLAVGFATVAVESQAARKRNQLPATAAAQATAAQSASQNLPAAKYPNGLPWRAVEQDFMDVKARISVVEGKVDDVKADTEAILSELDDIDADHVTIMNDLADIKAEIANVAGDVSDMADDVAMLKNALQVQVSVAPASADARNEANDAPVTLFVQVIQNGAGLSGLTADAFMFTNSFPVAGAGYCGTAACFSEGMDGLYALELAGDWVAGAYAGTLSAQDSGTAASGASLVTFEIPAEPVPSP